MSNGISVEKWVELCRDGEKIPVRTYLDGSSMEPLIRRGKNPVIILSIDDFPSVGKIVLFKNINGKYTVHRLYRVYEDTVQTFGDNCMFPDAVVPKKNVLGIVHSMEKNNKTVLLDCDRQIRYAEIWNKYLRKPYLKYRALRNKLHHYRKRIKF